MTTAIQDRTARKQVPAIYRKVLDLGWWDVSWTNLDIGGGPWDLFSDALAKMDVMNLIYDPKNRSVEHNAAVQAILDRIGKVDTGTISNVLNVIESADERKQVLELAKKYVQRAVFITVYEGDRSSIGRKTRDGYQLNRPLSGYLDEIKAVFPGCFIKSGLIMAKP